MSYIFHDNHIFPFKSNKLIEKERANKFKFIDNATEKYLKFYHEGTIPSFVTADISEKKPITSFEVGNTMYVQNPEYDRCVEILKHFKLDDKINPHIKLSDIPYLLEKKYFGKHNIRSFFPSTASFTKGGYNYVTEEHYEESDTETYDKNKAYPWALASLAYLIVCDWRTTTITKNPKSIIDHYYYVVKPAERTILLPENGIYPGYHLHKCDTASIEYELQYEMTTETIENHFSKMIPDLYKILTHDEFKKMIVVYIGKMDIGVHSHTDITINGVFKKNCVGGCVLDLDKKLTISYNKNETPAGMHTMKLIACQVKDKSRETVYDKLLELNLRNEDILQVRTDAFTVRKGVIHNIDLDAEDLSGWKLSNFKRLAPRSYDNDKQVTFLFENKHNENTRTLHNCLAGAGKTTYVLNELIPKLQDEGKTFIVLAPSHSALTPYRNKGIKCDVATTYSYGHKEIEEDFIIIDEFGFLDVGGHNLLQYLNLLNKSYECLGDFNQLLPVNCSEFSKDHYLRYMFNNIIDNTNNFRNNFPREYYIKLFSGEIDHVEEVNKYSTNNFTEADTILTWKNETRDTYNQAMLRYSRKKEHGIGVPYVCKTNKYKDFNICNNKLVKITKKDEDNIIIDDCLAIPIKEFDKNFVLGYARTIYNMQGDETESYYWAKEDNKHLNPRVAYTIISRLKGNIFE